MESGKESIARWDLLEEEVLEDCRVFTVERRRMRRETPPDLESDFYVIRSSDWVNVVALTDEDDLVLIEQWRHGVQKKTLEIPGGMVDSGETPRQAAERELREETGFGAREWHHLGTVEPNPAIQTNRCHTFLALGAERVEAPHFDRTEECRTVLHPWSEAARLVADQTIAHALVIAAFHWETLRRAGALEIRAGTGPEAPTLPS